MMVFGFCFFFGLLFIRILIYFPFFIGDTPMKKKKRCRYCLSHQHQPKSGEAVDKRGTNETMQRLEELSDNFFHIRVSLG